MKTWILALMAAAMIAGGPARALAQFSFEGLDLSEDEEAPKSPPKKLKPPPKQAPRQAPKKKPPARRSAGKKQVPAPQEAPAPPPVLTFEGLDVEGKTSDRQKLDAATRLFREGSFESAALGFHEILQDPGAVDQYPQAEYLLGKSLYRLGMYHSALSVFKRILAKGETHPYFATSLE
ncbi:MAG TPA: hypothetical protein VN033_10965, partial [Vulgatibacter sp.]|nr:hypothetical protein [Vulgatibacter sp.]